MKTKTIVIPAELDLAELAKTYDNKSKMIRHLASEGYKYGRIAEYLSVFYGKTMRYQHVRNVMTQEVKFVQG